MGASGIVERLRQPEYTGRNRCVPCTVLNAGLGVAVANVVTALATPLGAVPAVGAGLGALGACLVAIYLRGYLVPGTPRLARRYVPDGVRRRLEKSPTGGPFAFDAGRHGDFEALLEECGALEDHGDGGRPRLTEGFREAWRAEVATLEADDARRRAMAALFGADPLAIEIESREGGRLARLDGSPAGEWATEAAMVADLAGSNVLRERFGGWADLDTADRSEVLYGLRHLLETCPICGGGLAAEEAVVETCCREIDVVCVSCSDCGGRVLEGERAAVVGTAVGRSRVAR